MMKPKLLLTMLSLFFATSFAENEPDTANFNVLHGSAYYNATRTPGEAPSVFRNIYSPYLMYGSNLVTLSPTNGYGIASYTSGERTSFAAYMNNQVMLGIATKSLGFSFAFSVGEKLSFFEERSVYHKLEVDEIVGSSRNNFSLRLSLPFTSVDFTTVLRYSQSNNDSSNTQAYTDSKGKSTKEFSRHGHTFGGNLTFTNRPVAKDFTWSLGASATRYLNTLDSSYTSTRDPDENYDVETRSNQDYTYINLFYNFGNIVLKSKNGRVHVGNNTSISANIYDWLKDKENHRMDYYLQGAISFTPHILAEYFLTEKWMLWGSSYYTWSSSALREKYVEHWEIKGERRNNLMQFSTKTGVPYMSTGARFNYKSVTLEAGIEAGMYSNPFRGFDGKAVAYDFAGIITF